MSEGAPHVNPWLVALAVMSATFMEVLDTSVANVSLPHIAGSMSATTEEATWVLTSYLVSNAIVLPATNWLSNVFGRKRFLATCIALFTFSSLLCGISTSLGMLICARILQGVGGGALQPIAQAILMESFPPAKRGQAMAIYAMGIVVAPIVGPTLGGWITDNYSWRWVFLINLPIGVLSVFLVQWLIFDPSHVSRANVTRIDYWGFGLLIIWVGTLQLILDKGQQEDWLESQWIVGGLMLTFAAFVAFLIRELRTASPIVDLRVFHDRNFSVGTTLIFVLGGILYGSIALLPLFLQTLLRYPALQSGMAVSPRGIGAFLATIIVGRIIGKVDSRWLLAFGFTLLAGSSYMLSRLNLEIGFRSVAIPNLLSGVAMSCIFVPLMTVTMGTLRKEELGNATGIYSLMRNIGGGVGISAVTTLVSRTAQVHQAHLVTHLTPFDPAYNTALQQTQAVLTPMVGSAAAAHSSVGMLYRNLVTQSSLLSYIDNFRLFAFSAALALPLVFLFKQVKPGAKAVAAH
jgi:DHA2 family multidrug resistance protein